MGWEPIKIITPSKWYVFVGHRIGNTSIGFAGAFCPTAFFIGVELIKGSSRGIAFGIGPLWIGFAVLRPVAGGASE